MSAMRLDLGEFDLPERNRLAHATIVNYASGHSALDVGIGIAGIFVPLPFAGTAAMMASLAAQIPIYRSLAQRLGCIYETPHDDIVRGMIWSNTALDSAMTLGTDIVGQFGIDFLKELLHEIVTEAGLGIAASAIPILGGLVAAGFDAAIAATMTWRIGTMISIYFQNGGRWVKNREETYQRAKDLTGGLSAQIENRVNLDRVSERVPEVREYQVRQWMRFVTALLEHAPDLSDANIRRAMEKKGASADIADEVVRRIRKGDWGPDPELN